MVKTGSIIAVAVVAVVAFIAYQFLQGGGGGAPVSTKEASGAQTSNPYAYSSAPGAGAVSITEIYAPAYRSDYFSSSTNYQTVKAGLFNF